MSKATGKQRGGVTGKGFLPGESGNPNGRPRTAKFSEAVRRLAAESGAEPDGQTGAERLAQHCFKKGLQGSARHLALFLEYSEGRPKQGVELSGRFGTSGYRSGEEIRAEIADLEEQTEALLRKALLDPTSKLGYQIRELVQEIDKNEIEGVQSTDVKRSD